MGHESGEGMHTLDIVSAGNNPLEAMFCVIVWYAYVGHVRVKKPLQAMICVLRENPLEAMSFVYLYGMHRLDIVSEGNNPWNQCFS